MPLLSDIKDRQIAAMKAGEAQIVSVMRLLVTAIKNEQIAKQGELSDSDIEKVVARQVKQLQDSLKDFIAGGRQDLVDQTQQEIDILSDYLPEQLTDSELSAIVDRVVTELSATSVKDMGKVMGMVMKEVGSGADGNRVKEIVGKKLT